MRRAAAAAALLVAAASASDFENWNPNERDPDGKTDAQLLVERAEFVREQIDDGGHLDADHDHKRGHVDIVAPDEPALRAAIERANAMPEAKSVCIKLTASTVYVLTAPRHHVRRRRARILMCPHVRRATSSMKTSSGPATTTTKGSNPTNPSTSEECAREGRESGREMGEGAAFRL